MASHLKERVRRVLRDRGLLQRELAEAAGVTDSTISNIMHGRDPRYSTFEKVDGALKKFEEAHDRAS